VYNYDWIIKAVWGKCIDYLCERGVEKDVNGILRLFYMCFFKCIDWFSFGE
jgi:hypothetical protein